MMQHAESFRDLIVYQKARKVARRFFDLSKAVPKEERYSLADGEQQETQHWIDTELDCGYLTGQIRDELVDELERIGRMLQSMVDKAILWSIRSLCS